LRNVKFLAEKDRPRCCNECIDFHSKACEGALATDKACPNFAQGTGSEGRDSSVKRQGQKKTYTLAIYEEVPKTLKPCGFYGDVLTESAWLPYKDEENNVTLRPSIITVKKGSEPEISDFYKQDTVKGTFPSQELASLMDKQAVQMLTSHAVIEPHDIDTQIDEAFMRHLDMPQAEKILSKRWIEGTFFFDTFDAFPIQSILGVSESGKTRLCNLNLALAYHAEGLISPSEASIFRSKEEDKVSLIIDEAEYLNDPNLYATLRILINASYSKYSGYVSRYDESSDGKRVKRRFDLYSPMSISGIGGLEGVTLSRAFRVIMRRVNKDFPPANPNDYRTLRNMLYVLRIRHAFQVRELYEKIDISNIVSARFEELFKPLFCMTEFFGNNEEREILKDWCIEYQNNFRVESLNVAQEEQVLLCTSKLTKNDKQPDWFSLKELSDLVNIEYNRNISSAYVSNILYRLGITRRKKVRGYTLFYCPTELLEDSASRIGVSSSSPFDATFSTDSTNSNQKGEGKTKQEEEWIDESKDITQV